MKIILIILIIFIVLIFLSWLGLRVQPRPSPRLPAANPAARNHPSALRPARSGRALLSSDLRRPGSADRIGGAQRARHHGPVGGLKIPARFRFVHDVGQGYRHYFEMTWFGLKFGVGNEYYLDGKSRLEPAHGPER